MELIVALNTADPIQAHLWVKRLFPEARFFKVGLPLYLRGGAAFLRELKRQGLKVFLDLKFLDIPSVVAQAVEAAAALEPELLTVHALGGRAMLEAAQAALSPESPTELAAVTLLTSLDRSFLQTLTDTEIEPRKVVLNLARLAHEAGIRTVVASGQEVPLLRERFPELRLVVPGVRMEGEDRGDQQRVVTPEALRPYRPDYVVVGRPITGAPDPLAAYRAFREALR